MARVHDPTDNELTEAVMNSTAWNQVCRKLGIRIATPNIQGLRLRAESLQVSLDHFHSNERGPWSKHKSLEEHLQKGTSIGSVPLRKRLIKEKILKEECALCHLGPSWNGLSLTLQLDHINGDSSDNRLENLRILCPNCHTQTNTYAGRNKSKKVKIQECLDCGTKISRAGIRCVECSRKFQVGKNLKVDWPTIDELCELVEKNGLKPSARQLGTTMNSLKAQLRRNGKKWINKKVVDYDYEEETVMHR